MRATRLRAIPSVSRVLESLGETDLPRQLVVEVVRRQLRTLRSRSIRIPSFSSVLEDVRARLDAVRASRIRPVINGTGVLAHTNLGRAPLAETAMAAVSEVGRRYSTLEYSTLDGTRGERGAYLEHGLALLCATEAAAVVNNNAAALTLLLAHFCTEDTDEVVISRGELVQIGGGFRIPELLEAAGARIREVGTTNHTSVADYARAISRRTALVLKVHRSNFFMEGFVDAPSTEALAAVVRRHRVPLVEDLGSGALVRTDSIEGLEHEPTPAEVLGQGVDLVCFSGDKLLGGPQAGIIAGRRRHVGALKRAPLFRALRCDKLVLAALEATVDLYLRGDGTVPLVDMLRVDCEALRRRAERIVAALHDEHLDVRIGSGRGQVGGGTLPRSTLPSVTLDLRHPSLSARALAANLRQRPIPVVGYLAQGRVKIDLRTVFPREDDELLEALRAAAASAGS